MLARRALLAGLACAGLSACASPADELPASLETLRALRERAVPPMAVGAFRPASKDIGRSVTIRLSVMHAPKGSNYAEFLGQTFATELRAAGTLNLRLNVQSGAAGASLLVGSASDDGRPGPSLAQCIADPAQPEPMIGCGRLLLQVAPWLFCDGFERLPHVCGQPQSFP